MNSFEEKENQIQIKERNNKSDACGATHLFDSIKYH